MIDLEHTTDYFMGNLPTPQCPQNWAQLSMPFCVPHFPLLFKILQFRLGHWSSHTVVLLIGGQGQQSVDVLISVEVVDVVVVVLSVKWSDICHEKLYSCLTKFQF